MARQLWQQMRLDCLTFLPSVHPNTFKLSEITLLGVNEAYVHEGALESLPSGAIEWVSLGREHCIV